MRQTTEAIDILYFKIAHLMNIAACRETLTMFIE